MESADTTPIFLHGTNIARIWNNKMQPASSFTFSPVQLYSTWVGGTDKNKQLTIAKPMQTGINHNK
jgi:hypothetical protein